MEKPIKKALILEMSKKKDVTLQKISQELDLKPIEVLKLYRKWNVPIHNNNYYIPLPNSKKALIKTHNIGIFALKSRCKKFSISDHPRDYKVEKTLRKKPPSREDLLEFLRKNASFSEAGLFYGVTSQTIRNWCAKRDLPSKIDFYKDLEKPLNETLLRDILGGISFEEKYGISARKARKWKRTLSQIFL